MEVMKTNAESFDAAVQLSLSVDRAFTTFTEGYSSGPSNGTAGFSSPLEIRNIQRGRISRQRADDMARNACCTCHELSCRPWKYKWPPGRNGQLRDSKNPKMNNLKLDNGDSESRSENE